MTTEKVPEEFLKVITDFVADLRNTFPEYDPLINKWWKKDEEDWDNVKVELVDMLHFWVSMCTVADMDAKEVMELYAKKNKLNFKRQDEGYKEGTYDKYKDGIEDNKVHVLGSE